LFSSYVSRSGRAPPSIAAINISAAAIFGPDGAAEGAAGEAGTMGEPRPRFASAHSSSAPDKGGNPPCALSRLGAWQFAERNDIFVLEALVATPALNRTSAEIMMFIQTEATPNPVTLKFLPGRIVLESGAREFRSLEDAKTSPLAEALLSINGVEGAMFARDFVSVTKGEDADWAQLKPAILGTIMEHFLSGAPLFADEAAKAQAGDEFFDVKDAETVDAIKDLLETRVRPAVAGDGGDIVFKGYRDGVVYLGMKGACSGCPSSAATLKSGVERLLRHFLPQVRAVEQL
jgi:Fe-S cluster biogenesis protein NfuA